MALVVSDLTLASAAEIVGSDGRVAKEPEARGQAQA
jgi:hypothetical protein